MFAALLAGSLFLKSMIENQYFFHVARISMQVRKVVTDAVYNKSLRLSSASKATSTTGEIVNLMQLDANRLSLMILQLHVIWSGVFQIIGYSAQVSAVIGRRWFDLI